MERTRTLLRATLLDAAEAVVARQGIANLTLESVAAEAGMSKGGLLHHFRTKDRLIEALVRRAAENWRACAIMTLAEGLSSSRPIDESTGSPQIPLQIEVTTGLVSGSMTTGKVASCTNAARHSE